MDQRQPPHSYSRSQDRPLIQNPNHQIPSHAPPPSHATLYHTPSSQQPPVQIPFSDPFQRRAPDPFLPNTQGQRRGSYGIPSARDVVSGGGHADRPSLAGAWPSTTAGSASTPSLLHQHHPQSGAPPPPSLSTAPGGSAAVPYAYDHSRRRSLGGHSPPQYYGAVSNEPPTSLAAFANRQMPPPSPSQQAPPATVYPGARGPPPPTYPSGRELPGLGRPGTGMSISSILGTDAPTTQSSTPAGQHSPTINNQSPTSVSMQPPSPRRQNVGPRMDYGQQWRRPQTPDRFPLPAALRASDNPPFSANSSPRLFHPSRGSPENNRNGPPILHHMYPSSNGPAPRQPYQSSPTEQQERDFPRQSEERVPPRPNSQPAGYAQSPRDGGLRDVMAALNSRQPVYGSAQFDRRPGQEDQRHLGPVFGDRNGHPPSSRPVEHTSHAYSPPHDQRGQLGSGRDDAGRENPMRRDDYNTPFRTGFRNQPYQPHGPEAPRSHPHTMDPFRQANEGRNPLFPPDYRPMERTPSSHPHDQHNQDRRTSEPRPSAHGLEMQRTWSDRPTPFSMERSRSSLGIGPDGKRGRASPLPQAVQGAQAQLTGPGGDPGIKSEFGRIYTGLGGIGGHGSSTPSRQSPLPQRVAPDVEPIVLSDGDSGKMTRVGSKGLKKGGRVKEEDGRHDSENDGRGTPLSGARGSKRAKVGHHHHLPHPHNHPHHHVHVHDHNARPPAFPPSVSHATPTPSAHHHHHIHPGPHHHHHTPRPAIVLIPKPSTTINSKAVLDSVKALPSSHLGSELYSPKITLPPQSSVPAISEKYGYFLQYQPSRTFTQSDLNCTYTIRVAREYLTRQAREKICADRNIFGSGVYTDDSDPVAVCIHDGWIRGEWSEDISTELMDIPPPPPIDQEVDEEMIQKPEQPIVPPEDMDLHITIRVLLPLKQYKGTVLNGIDSRDWGCDGEEDHDGFSWAVDKVRWVDERGGRFVERTGKARRARLEAAQSLVSMLTEGPEKGLNARVNAMPMAAQVGA